VSTHIAAAIEPTNLDAGTALCAIFFDVLRVRTSGAISLTKMGQA